MRGGDVLTELVQIGMLERGEAHAGITSFFASKGRAEAVDLSVIIDYAV